MPKCPCCANRVWVDTSTFHPDGLVDVVINGTLKELRVSISRADLLAMALEVAEPTRDETPDVD
jgi:hypothetical protein